MAAEIIKRHQVDTWEKEAFRKMNLLPRDINGQLGVNLAK
jgi:hypothetical protein